MIGSKKASFFGLEKWETDYLKKNLKGYRLSFFDEPLSLMNIGKAKDAQVIGIFIYSRITSDILERLPKLEMIATLSTGFDHIDIGSCTKRGITVCNVPTYGENTVAEHTFALILALSRKIFESAQRTKNGSFDYYGLRGFDLKDKTIGLIGTGHISAHVARIAHGFDMKILGYDIREDPMLKDQYGLEYTDIKTLLERSDIVSLHLPLNEHTRHIINRKNIRLLKSSAIIINTARGGLIETDALLKALLAKKIAGAGLDVLEEENSIKEEKQLISKSGPTGGSGKFDMQTLMENHILLKADNVIVTPHNAFNSEEALKRILDTSISNIENYRKNPQNTVDVNILKEAKIPNIKEGKTKR